MSSNQHSVTFDILNVIEPAAANVADAGSITFDHILMTFYHIFDNNVRKRFPDIPCSRVDTCLSTPSQGSSAKCATDPYEDTKSEGINQLSSESLRLSLSPPPKCLLCLLVF